MPRGTAALALLAALLPGCRVLPPTQAELESASYGEKPSDHRLKIKDAFSSILIDPASARFEFGAPEQGWGRSGGGNVFGWVVWTRVDAKNRFGDHAGWREFKVLLKEDRVVGIYRENGTDEAGNTVWEKLF